MSCIFWSMTKLFICFTSLLNICNTYMVSLMPSKLAKAFRLFIKNDINFKNPKVKINIKKKLK